MILTKHMMSILMLHSNIHLQNLKHALKTGIYKVVQTHRQQMVTA